MGTSEYEGEWLVYNVKYDSKIGDDRGMSKRRRRGWRQGSGKEGERLYTLPRRKYASMLRAYKYESRDGPTGDLALLVHQIPRSHISFL